MNFNNFIQLFNKQFNKSLYLFESTGQWSSLPFTISENFEKEFIDEYNYINSNFKDDFEELWNEINKRSIYCKFCGTRFLYKERFEHCTKKEHKDAYKEWVIIDYQYNKLKLIDCFK